MGTVTSRGCSGPNVLGQPPPNLPPPTLYCIVWTGKCSTADKGTVLGSHIRLGMREVRRMVPCAGPGCFSLHLPHAQRLRTHLPVPTCRSTGQTTRPQSGSRESWPRLTPDSPTVKAHTETCSREPWQTGDITGLSPQVLWGTPVQGVYCSLPLPDPSREILPSAVTRPPSTPSRPVPNKVP